MRESYKVMELKDLPAHRVRLRELLDQQGIRSALVYMNGLTSHRFTALYRFANDTLKKIYFYDRENPNADSCPDIPIEASYCIFIKETGRNFKTANSIADNRLDKHAKQKEILSYCGVPLVDMDGQMFGSVCHFNFEAMPIANSMVELMEDLSTMIMERPDLIK